MVNINTPSITPIVKTPSIKLELQQLFANHKIVSVTCDSRDVFPGCAYFAISGSKNDGNDFIDEAKSNGAKLIFTENAFIKATKGESDIILISDIRYVLSIAAGIIYPKLPDKLIAVTGTNGKTSVVSYCYSILSKLGVKAASMGTLGIETNVTCDLVCATAGGLTTADSVAFRRNLHGLAEAGVEVVVFEASSHGLDQDRLGDVKVDAAGFVSFSQDHLDYHGSMENYLAAKLRLFTEHLKPDASVTLPIDINCAEEIISFLNLHNIRYGLIGQSKLSHNCFSDARDFSTLEFPSEAMVSGKFFNNSDKNTILNAVDRVSVNIHSIESCITHQTIQFSYTKNTNHHNDTFSLSMPIIGSFQANNVILAIELLQLIGFDKKTICNAADGIEGVMGRLQRVSKTYNVFVDYAHTPDALEKALIELKKLKAMDARLIVVFGCGGDRDKLKRPIMGKVAEDLADIIIVTDDNPRYEDASLIRKEIISGMKSDTRTDQSRLHEISDRGKAIEVAIKMMKKIDIVLIAGKGHENYQIIKGDKIEFSDISVSQDILQR